jgi:F-type H+-transporting ATPase subunit a
MDGIGKVVLKTIDIFGLSITINPLMFYMTWLVMAVILLFAFFATRKMSVIPKKIQGVFELLLEFLDEITMSTLGEEDGKKYTPLIITIFIFMIFSNWISIIPNIFKFMGGIIAVTYKLFGADSVTIAVKSITNIQVIPDPSSWYYFLFKIPAIESPTKYLSTDFAVAIIVFFVAHINAIKCNGFVNYFKGYMEPLPSGAPWIYFFFLNPFFYLNIISQIGNVVSHAFRLFGNVFGGGIIILIVSELLKQFLVPVGLFAFFGLFSGIIQAFVFTMLAVTYIATAK